jgi:HEAT repeat protein
VLGLLGGWAEAEAPPGAERARLRGYVAALEDTDDAVAARALQQLGWHRESLEPPVLARAVAFVQGPRMERLLRHPSTDVRAFALDALARFGDGGGASVALAVELLKDPDRLVRANAASALGRMGKAARAHLPLILSQLGRNDTPGGLEAAVVEIIRDDPVPVLAPLLASPKQLTVQFAVEMAGLVGEPAVVLAPRLAELLKTEYAHPSEHRSQEIHMALVHALGRMSPAVSQAPLLGELLGKGPFTGSRAAAAEALGRMGPAAVSQAPRLGVVLLEAPDESVRAAAARALGKMGPAARAQASLLVRGLRDTHGSVVVEVGEALALLGPLERKLFVRLVEALTHPSEHVREAAATALGGADPREQLPMLVELLKREEPLARMGAALAIMHMGGKARGQAARLTALAGDPDVGVRVAAVKALEAMEEWAPIPGFFKDAHPAVRAAAVGVFLTPRGKMAEPLAPALGALLRDDPDENVRGNALGALRRLGPAARPYVPLIAQELTRSDSNDTDKTYALAALKELGEVAADQSALVARFTRERDSTLRSYAILSLGHMRARDQLPLLISLLDTKVAEDTRTSIEYAIELMAPCELPALASLLARAERVPQERSSMLLLAHVVGGGAPSAERLLRWMARPTDEAAVSRLSLEEARAALEVFADFWPATEPHPALREKLAARVAQVTGLATGSWRKSELPLLKRHEANLAAYPARLGPVQAALRAVAP